MEDLQAIGHSQNLPTKVEPHIDIELTVRGDMERSREHQDSKPLSASWDFDRSWELGRQTPPDSSQWSQPYLFNMDFGTETNFLVGNSNGTQSPSAQPASAPRHAGTAPAPRSAVRTTTPRSAGSSTTSGGTKRARQVDLSSHTSSGKRHASALTSAQPQVSTRAPDDDWFRERGQVLPRGDDSDGIRRTGRIRRPPPPTHSTHSIFASVNEAKSDSDSSSALPRTEHQSRAQACEDANLIPSFLAHEVKPTAKDTSDWDLADSREWDGLIKMGCFEWVSDSEQLPGERIYSSRFVRVVKDKYPSSHPKHFKSRLVVQQLKRIHRDDPGELYSPTPSQESARLLTWYAARQGERIFGIDCVQAYLNSPAPTAKGSRIFIRPPKERKKSGHILLLHKYLYGLRRAAKAWNMTLLKAFKAMGFRSLRTELCVLVRDPSGQRPTIVDFHVDDIRVVGDAPMNSSNTGSLIRYSKDTTKSPK